MTDTVASTERTARLMALRMARGPLATGAVLMVIVVGCGAPGPTTSAPLGSPPSSPVPTSTSTSTTVSTTTTVVTTTSPSELSKTAPPFLPAPPTSTTRPPPTTKPFVPVDRELVRRAISAFDPDGVVGDAVECTITGMVADYDIEGTSPGATAQFAVVVPGQVPSADIEAQKFAQVVQAAAYDCGRSIGIDTARELASGLEVIVLLPRPSKP
jgi:hypothetical protein